MKNNIPRLYPDDFPGDKELIKSFDKQVIELLKKYFDMAWDDIKWYSESDSAYELYGCDFMMDTDKHVYLIEINSKPGFLKTLREPLTKSLIGGIVEFALNNPQGNSGTELKEVIIVATNEKNNKLSRNELSDNNNSRIELLNREKHYDGLFLVTQDYKTMKRVGLGKIWNKEKLNNLFEWDEKDKTPLDKRKYISYVIISDNIVVGLLQFHPSASNKRDDPRLYVTIFIQEKFQGKGLGTMALNQAIKEIQKVNKLASFGAHIAFDNNPSINLHKKVGFKYEAIEKINNNDYLAFALPPPLPENAKNTYILDIENLELPEHNKTLNEQGLKQIDIDMAFKMGGCQLIITHGALATDKRMYKIVSIMRSRIYAESITNKVLLHNTMQKVKVNGREVVAKVKILHNSNNIPTFNDDNNNPLLWIWRPEGGWAGKGITIGKGPKDLEKLFKEQRPLTGLLTQFNDNIMLLPWRAREFKDEPGHPESPNPVYHHPEKYDMDNVELRKFHLRVYAVIISDQYGKRMGLYNNTHLICFADTKFIPNKYDDITMHNTRLRGYNAKIFPDTFDMYATEAKSMGQKILLTSKQIMEHLRDQFKAVAIACMPAVRPYAESHYGCEILGCDIMLNEDGMPWIVEMNKKHASFKMSVELAHAVSHNLYQGLFAYLQKPGNNDYISEVYFDDMSIGKKNNNLLAGAYNIDKLSLPVQYNLLKLVNGQFGYKLGPEIIADFKNTIEGDPIHYLDGFARIRKSIKKLNVAGAVDTKDEQNNKDNKDNKDNNKIDIKSYMKRSKNRIDEIRKWIENIKDANYLDYGGGDGSISLAVAETIKAKSLTVTDITDRPNNLPEHVTFVNVLKESIPKIKNGYDLITIYMVIHHLPNPLETLKELVDLLSENGKIIIREHPTSCNGLTKKELHQFLDFQHILYTDNFLNNKYYNFEELKKMAESLNLKCVDYSYGKGCSYVALYEKA
jgi:RimJ/RimL family protein N-acetyltransferase/ubiquinone/menaquinone biosynthesis C-methylase UbiE